MPSSARPLRAALYLRQSLDRSGEGEAVARQEAECRRLAAYRGWEVVEVFTDNDTSATQRKPRPAYNRMLNAMRARTIDAVVVLHVDRLTRRLADLEEVVDVCKDSGCTLVTVVGGLDLSDDAGISNALILASVASGEVRRKGARQRLANKQRREAGSMAWTRRPFGYTRALDGTIVVIEEEAAGLREAAAVVLAGGTLSAAARSIAARGLTTSTGRPTFTVTSLRHMLLNPRYRGAVTYMGKVHGAVGTWPPILTEEEQRRLAEVLHDPSRRMALSTEPRYLLSGVAQCGRCGSVMRGSPMTSKGRRWHVYKCAQKGCRLARRSDLVDEMVTAVLVGRLSMPDAATLLVPNVDVDALRAETVDLRARRDALAEMLADGLMGPVVVRERATMLTERLRDLEQRIGRAVGDSPAAALVGADDVAATWTGLPLRTRKVIVDMLLTVEVLPAGKGARFSPEHIRLTWKRP